MAGEKNARAEFLGSSLLAREGFRHAFFTRQGGNSPAPFDSLHFGAEGHAPEHLAANVRAAAFALGVEANHLYVATQVHGRDVAFVGQNEPRESVLRQRADAIVSSVRSAACGVKIADCVPVLVGDRASGAALAIHSGWQGTEIDVVAAGIAALRREIGQGGDLVAAVGPHIEACCFEVGDDVAARLQACAPQLDVVLRGRGPRPHVDLRGIVHAQLRAAGLAQEAIDDVRGCTKCDPHRFFSHRRDAAKSGRLLAAIVVREAR